jgi:WD40 repeat protein
MPVLSPDLVCLAVGMPGMVQIYRTDNPGEMPVRVDLPPETRATWLSWSPDSQQLVYPLNEGTTPGLDVSPALGLWVWESQTGQARQVISVNSPEAALHGWTADGRMAILEALEGISQQVIISLVDIATGQSSSVHLPEGSRMVGRVGSLPSAALTLLPHAIG